MSVCTPVKRWPYEKSGSSKSPASWKPCICVTGGCNNKWQICERSSALSSGKKFERYGLAITRQNMANWMIRLGEEYLGVRYDYLHSRLYNHHVIQADETTVLVNRDGHPAGSRSYMWYRSGFMYPDRQIMLYEYQKTRNASHPRAFLKGYTGICVTDGYQVYHTLEKEIEELTIAGCWVHARRRFDEALKTVPEPGRRKSMSYLVMKQIQAIYREEGKLKELPSKERLEQWLVIIKPLVNALFAYPRLHDHEVPANGKLREGFTYPLNQERYLRVFLTDGDIPIDNNASLFSYVDNRRKSSSVDFV